jgi:glutathione peroxidase
MRRAALLAVCGACAAAGSGCGGDDASSPRASAASSDETVQRAGTPAVAPAVPAPGAEHAGRDTGVLRGTYARLNGERDDLARYRGDVVLVVNTATECGFTPQFEGLEALYRARRGDGLVVLGFPANDFAGQEPRSNKDIAVFCKANYGVSFPMFAKTNVVGEHANPLFRRLTAAAGAPEWNFNKYLVDRRGRVVARFGAGTEPDAPELVRRIERLL